MLETKLKNKLIEEIKKEGGYARRIEDQFAVGMPDMVVCYHSTGLVLLEVKVAATIKTAYGATPRQAIEIKRIVQAGGKAALLGILTDYTEMALSPGLTATRIDREERRRGGETFERLLKRYLNGGMDIG